MLEGDSENWRQDITRLKQWRRESPCQDPSGNQTTRRFPDHRKETQTEVIWTCVAFLRSGQNHLARHSERGGETTQTEEKKERQHQEWTGLEFAKSQRAVENRGKWRKLVVKSSVVPQRPSRLRNRRNDDDDVCMCRERGSYFALQKS